MLKYFSNILFLRGNVICFAAFWPIIAGLAAAASAANINVTRFGVIGDDKTLNTAAIQKAIDDCSANGSGKVVFPAGRYLTGTIQIKSGVTLHLDNGTMLLGSQAWDSSGKLESQ